MSKPVGGRNERGAVTLLVAVAIIAILGFAALAIDVGRGLATKAELQNVADSGAMAGTRELARIYNEQVALGPFDYTQYTMTRADESRVSSRVNEYTQQNLAAGVPISVDLADVVYGVWDGTTKTFTEGSKGVNALTVRARRDDQTNGSLATMLAFMLGVDSYAIRADTSVNVLSGLKSLPSGKGDVPFAISKAWFNGKDSPCGPNSKIRFYPTGSMLGCAGWHVFNETPASASKLRNIIQDLDSGTYTTPETVAGDTYYNFTGGTVASAFPAFVDLFESKKGDDGTWKIHVPVYDQDNCDNPTGMIKIIGFATARITEVLSSPQKRIEADVECEIVDWGQSDGPSFGTSVEATRLIE